MPTVQLSEEQKVRVRVALGYPNVAESATFALGVPANVEIAFLIESAMNKLLPAGRAELERVLGIIDGIEAQMVDDLELVAANQVGEIEVNQAEQQQLTERYDYFVAYLSNMLTVPRNPWDARLTARGGVNARVAR